MKKKLLLVWMALLSLTGAYAAPVMPTISTLTSYSYYTVTFARQSTKCLQDNGVGANITQVAPIPATAAQEWRFEPIAPGATTYCLVSKLGNRISFSSKYVTAATGNQFTLVATTNGSYLDKWELADVGGMVMNDEAGTTVTKYYANDGGNPLILTFVETVAHTIVPSEYTPYITNARTYYNNATEGTGFGLVPAAARTTFNAVIAAEEAKDANTLTSQQMFDGIVALQNATTAFAATVLNSTPEGAPYKWYTMESAKFPGKYLTLNPTTKVLTVAAKDNSANQLFRYSKKPSLDSYTNLHVITCQSLQTGNIRCNSGWGTVYDTNLNFPTDGTYNYVAMGYWPWNVTLVLGQNGVQTLLQSADWDGMGVNADGVTVENNIGGYNGANAWKIAFVSQDDVATQNYYTARDNARAFYNNSTAGTGYGQFTATARTAFNSAIATEEAKNPGAMTAQEKLDGIAALQTATTAYSATAITTPNPDPTVFNWYTMESAKFPGKFLTLDPVTKAITLTAKDNSNNQLFRFEKKPDYLRGATTFSKLHNIICKSLQAGTIRCENAAWDVVYNTGTAFSGGASTSLGYWPWEMTLTFGKNGVETLLESLDWDGLAAAADGIAIENNPVGTYNGENAWKMAYVSQDNALVASKTQLSIDIFNATAFNTAAVAGTSPGQYPQAAKDVLTAAVATAQLVLDNASATTAQNNDASTALLAAVFTLKGTVLLAFETSTAAAPKWYYMQGAGVATPTLYCFDKAINLNSMSDLTWTTVAVTASQLFRFERIAGTGTFRIINELLPNGEVLATSSPILYGTPTNTAWTLETLTGADGNQYRIKSNGKILHLAASGTDLVSWDAGYNSASAFKFTPVSDATALQAITNSLATVVTDAQAIYTASVVGTNPGQVTTANKTTFQNAIDAATIVKNNASATVSEKSAAIATMIAAQSAFLTSSLPKVSTTGNDTWYYIKAQRGNASPFYFTAKVAKTTVTCDALTSTDYQLWKVVANGAGYALQNKGDNSYLNYDASPFGTKAAMPTKNFNFYPSTYLATAFHIYGSGYTVHAGGGAGGLQSYGVLSDNCSYLFVEYIPAQALIASITDAQATYTAAPAGANPGQYLAANKVTFQNAIDAAIVVRDKVSPVSTPTESMAAIAALGIAKATFLASTTAPFKYSTTGSTTWYKIKNAAVPPRTQPYLTDGGIAAGVLGSVDSSNESLLWKVVDMGSGNVNVISKVNSGHIEIPAANSVTVNLVSVAQLWKIVSVGYAQYGVQSTTGTIRSWHLAGGNNLVTYGSPALNGGNSFLFEEVSTITGANKTESAIITVAVVNRMLVVTGTDAAVKAFTVTGAQVNATKALNPGIYIVKVGDKTVKVNVQ